MITFIKTKDPENEYDVSDIKMDLGSDVVLLHEVIREFSYFLKAIGYHFESIGIQKMEDDEYEAVEEIYP